MLNILSGLAKGSSGSSSSSSGRDDTAQNIAEGVASVFSTLNERASKILKRAYEFAVAPDPRLARMPTLFRFSEAQHVTTPFNTWYPLAVEAVGHLQQQNEQALQEGDFLLHLTLEQKITHAEYFLTCFQNWEIMIQQPTVLCMSYMKRRLESLRTGHPSSDTGEIQKASAGTATDDLRFETDESTVLEELLHQLNRLLDSSTGVMAAVAAVGRALRDENYAVLNELSIPVLPTPTAPPGGLEYSTRNREAHEARIRSLTPPQQAFSHPTPSAPPPKHSTKLTQQTGNSLDTKSMDTFRRTVPEDPPSIPTSGQKRQLPLREQARPRQLPIHEQPTETVTAATSPSTTSEENKEHKIDGTQLKDKSPTHEKETVQYNTEVAKQQRRAEEAEIQRMAEEAERQRQLALEEERRRAEEAEQQRLAEEAEQQRRAEEAEIQRMAEEAERQRQLALEEERRRAEAAEQQRLAEEAEQQTVEVVEDAVPWESKGTAVPVALPGEGSETRGVPSDGGGGMPIVGRRAGSGRGTSSGGLSLAQFKGKLASSSAGAAKRGRGGRGGVTGNLAAVRSLLGSRAEVSSGDSVVQELIKAESRARVVVQREEQGSFLPIANDFIMVQALSREKARAASTRPAGAETKAEASGWSDDEGVDGFVPVAPGPSKPAKELVPVQVPPTAAAPTLSRGKSAPGLAAVSKHPGLALGTQRSAKAPNPNPNPASAAPAKRAEPVKLVKDDSGGWDDDDDDW